MWSGQPVEVTAGDGTQVDVRLHPRPIQAELPLYAAVVGNLAARGEHRPVPAYPRRAWPRSHGPEAYRPFVSCLRSSLALFDQVTNSLGFDVDLANTSEEDVEFLLGRAYERYCASREIACFVDFGVPRQQVLAGLPVLDRVRRRPTFEYSTDLFTASTVEEWARSLTALLAELP